MAKDTIAKEVRFNIPVGGDGQPEAEAVDLVQQFNALRVMRGEDEFSAFARLMQAEVNRNKKRLDGKRLVTQADLMTEAEQAGRKIVRGTLYTYRNDGTLRLGEHWFTDGLTVLFDLQPSLEAILAKNKEQAA